MRDTRFQNIALPDLVRKYLRYAFKENQPLIKTVRLSHNGYFKISLGGGWVKVRGEQFFRTELPEVVWIGKTRLFKAIYNFKDVNEHSVGN